MFIAAKVKCLNQNHIIVCCSKCLKTASVDSSCLLTVLQMLQNNFWKGYTITTELQWKTNRKSHMAHLTVWRHNSVLVLINKVNLCWAD